jgi:hypothetical protein
MGDSAMFLQLILMCAAVLIAVIVVFSSKLLRTICIEAVLRRGQACEIHVKNDGVSVSRILSGDKED